MSDQRDTKEHKVEIELAIFNVDIAPDYVVRMEAEGVDLASLEVTIRFSAYDGTSWTEDEFSASLAPDHSVSPPDFTVFTTFSSTVPDTAVRASARLSLDGQRNGAAFHVGDGFADLPHLFAPRSLVEISCVDLDPPDAGNSDDPEVAMLDLRVDFGYLTWRIGTVPAPTASLSTLGAPYPSTVYLDPQADTSTAPNLWEYRPQSDSTVVVGSSEWPSRAADALNWQSWNIAEEAKPVADGRFQGVFHRSRPLQKHGGQQVFRSAGEVDTVVLHETAGWQIDRTNYVPESWRTDSLAAQFKVQTDGRVVQMYDALQTTSHVATPGINDRSVGIEVVNIMYPSEVKNLTAKQVEARFARWDGRDNVYVFETLPSFLRDTSPRALVRLRGKEWGILPTAAQLEATYLLTAQLVTLGIRPENPLGDPGLVFPTDLIVTDDADRFLMDPWVSMVSALHGVFAHGSVQDNKSDGHAVALYTWLRSGSRLAASGPDNAFESLLDIFDEGLIRHRCADGAQRWCADTTPWSPPRHVRELA